MNDRQPRFRYSLMLGAAFLAGGAAMSMAGIISRAVAQDRSRAEASQFLKVFGDVFERVRSEYVDPVGDKEILENAINGMLTGLDPHSSYMNAKAFKDMQVQTKGGVRRPGAGSDRGKRPDQGRFPDRRYPGVSVRNQSR